MNIAFFGTPDLATIILDHLHDGGFAPTLVVTQPDRPAGRGQHVTPPAAKTWAIDHDIDVIQPENLNDDPQLDILFNSEWDMFIVAAYGLIIPQTILDLPKHKTINVHPSLLPKYRGPTPIQSQILNDDRSCGVTIMLMDAKMDHGPILTQASIEPEEWPLKASLLNDILWHAGGEVLLETIPDWIAGAITPEEQDHERATYTKKMNKADGEIDLSTDGYQNYLTFCAYHPWPGVYFFNSAGKRVKITEATFSDEGFQPLRIIEEGKGETTYRP